MDTVKRRNIRIIALIVLLLCIAGLYIILYLIPDISNALMETYVVNAYTMEKSYKAEALIVRNEKCCFAETDGSISYYISESEKTRIGTRIADIYSGINKISLCAESTGFVSFFYDGLEDRVTPEKVLTGEPSDFLEYKSIPVLGMSNFVSEGSFVYKLVDGSTWYLLIPIKQEMLPAFRIGSDIELVLEDGRVLTGNAERVIGKDSLALMVRVLSYFPEFCQIRNLDVNVIAKKTEGLRIPKTAVAAENEHMGVYRLGSDDELHFDRINILDEDENTYLVSEDFFDDIQADGSVKKVITVSLYDEILRDASRYKE